MKTKCFLIIFIICISQIHVLIGQDIYGDFNKLPLTNATSAPVFSTVSKYIFKIDTFSNSLLIQDLSSSMDGKKIHFYQRLYEIPLKDLNIGSFKVRRPPEEKNSIEILIGTTSNRKSINKYLFQNNKVEMIQSGDRLTLGRWQNSDSLYLEIKKIIKKITLSIKDTIYSTNHYKHAEYVFKYKSDKIVGGNDLDEDSSIGNNYYYGKTFKNNGTTKFPKLAIDLNRSLKKENQNYPHAIIVYTNNEGKIESIFAQGNSTFEVNVDEHKNIKPTKVNRQSVKTKFLFLLE